MFIELLKLFGPFGLPVLLSSIVAAAGLCAGGIFIWAYYRKFYGVAPAPAGWKTFYLGLMLNAAAQFLEVPFTYGWIDGAGLVWLYLIYQVVAAVVLVWGLWLLKREVV
jgi:hypothetical protein